MRYVALALGLLGFAAPASAQARNAPVGMLNLENPCQLVRDVQATLGQRLTGKGASNGPLSRHATCEWRSADGSFFAEFEVDLFQDESDFSVLLGWVNDESGPMTLVRGIGEEAYEGGYSTAAGTGSEIVVLYRSVNLRVRVMSKGKDASATAQRLARTLVAEVR